MTPAEFQVACDRVREAADAMGRGGNPIRFLHSTFVPEDESAFCVFSAASGELVADAYRRAGVPFQRMVDALELRG